VTKKAIALDVSNAFTVSSSPLHSDLKRGSLGPEGLKAACAAYDAAWPEVASLFSSSAKAEQLGRAQLANAVLSIAGDHMTNVDELKNLALRIMAVKLRHAGHDIRPPIGYPARGRRLSER
jgi:hemoglobin-like flavoprotein